MVVLSLPKDGIGLSLAEVMDIRGNCQGVALPTFVYRGDFVRVSSVEGNRAVIWKLGGKRHQTWIPWSLTADPRELICISRWPPVTELASRREVGRITTNNLRFGVCPGCGMTFLRTRAPYCTQLCKHRHMATG